MPKEVVDKINMTSKYVYILPHNIQKASKRKQRVVLNDNNNSKKKTTQLQVANNKSHLMRQQYHKLMNLERFLAAEYHKLEQIQDELRDVVVTLGVISDDGGCNQENRWTTVADNSITVSFVGKDAHNR
eukprot:405821_1